MPGPQGKSPPTSTTASKSAINTGFHRARRVCAGYRFAVVGRGTGQPGGSFNQTAAPCARPTARAGSGRPVRPRDRCGLRRRGVRGGRRPAFAVVRRGRDDLGVDPIGARTVAADPQHRCGARPVLPLHARLVRGLSGDRVLVAAVQLRCRRGGRCGRGGPGQAVLDSHRSRLRRNRFRDSAASHVGRNRGQVLRADGGGGGLADRAGGCGGTTQRGGAVAAVRVGPGGVDAAQCVRGADGLGTCGRGAGGGEQAVDGGVVGRHVGDGIAGCFAVSGVLPHTNRAGQMDFTGSAGHVRRHRTGAVFRPQCPVRPSGGRGPGGPVGGAAAMGSQKQATRDHRAGVDRAPDGGVAAVFGCGATDLLPALSLLHLARDGPAARGLHRGAGPNSRTRDGGAGRIRTRGHPELPGRPARARMPRKAWTSARWPTSSPRTPPPAIA